MTGNDPTIVHRIIVCGGALPTGRASLDMAAELAARLRAELSGLYIEDSTMARLAEHPTVRLVGTSGSALPAGNALLGRALRARSEAMRQALAEAAERRQVDHTFTVRRGMTDMEVRNAAHEADLVLLAWTGSETVPRQGRILVLHDGSEAGDRAFATAVEVARRLDREVGVLLLARSQARAVKLHREMEARAETLAVSAYVQFIPEPTPTLTARAVTALRGALLLMPRDNPLLEGETGHRFLDLTPSPVVLVG